MKYLTLSLLILVHCIAGRDLARRPNIIVFLVDDLGWNDVGFHGPTDVKTPNIDRLAAAGVTLSNYYVSPICTPTRGALMTGRHPVQIGLQHYVIAGCTPYGLPLNETTMAQHLKRLGYSTHIVGKWHLGHFAKEYLPMRRGFDSHYGIYLAAGDYYDHTMDDLYDGLDFRRMEEVDREDIGKYSTELYNTESVNIIRSHNKSKPLFLYLASQGVHAGNFEDPLQAPQKYINRNLHIPNPRRRIFAGMLTAVDDMIGNVIHALNETGLLSNTVIAFSTDNGGPAYHMDFNAASNWPLRGEKMSLWEGGVRGAGFIYSDLLHKKQYTSKNLMHVTDWLPTLYSAAGGNISDLGDIYGIDMWNMLMKDGPQLRHELLHNIDPIFKHSAIREGNYKLIVGNVSNGEYDDWYPQPSGKNFSNIHLYLKKPNYQPSNNNIVVQCGPKPYNASTNCMPLKARCLYDISKDPCEYNNIAHSHPHIVKELTERLRYWSAHSIPPGNKGIDPRSNPALHNGVWGPWINLTRTEH